MFIIKIEISLCVNKNNKVIFIINANAIRIVYDIYMDKVHIYIIKIEILLLYNQ
jgi:hypothetical protein